MQMTSHQDAPKNPDNQKFNNDLKSFDNARKEEKIRRPQK